MSTDDGVGRRYVNFSRPQRTPSVKSVASTITSQAQSVQSLPPNVRSQAPSVLSQTPSVRSQAPSLKSSLKSQTPSTKSTKSSVSTIRGMFSRFSSTTSLRSVSESEREEVLPYRPAKTKFVQYHVTTDIPSAQRRPQSKRIPTMDQRARPPAIPERTTSLEPQGHKKSQSQTWPPNTQEKKAGSFEFDTPPTLTRTPWEIDRGRPGSRWSRSIDRTQNQPRKVFVQLPREIYQCVLDSLEAVHSQQGTVDVLALRKDLRSLSLVDKKWQHIAREHMFRELWLPTNKASAKKRFSTRQPKSRLKILVELLRKTSGLGFLIHHIRVGAELAQELDAEAFAPFKKDSALDSLQLIIRDCYNLEQLSGFVLPATESTTPVLEALASRTRLKSHAWSLDSTRALPGLEHFIFCHDDWVNLETLAIAADPGVDLGIGTISAVLHRLPALKHLAVFGLHRLDFHNTSLLTLPPVKSLRLECLSGLTDQGVEQMAFSRLALSLERLTLVGLELASLQCIQTLLSHLTRLKRFALLQEASPEPIADTTPAGRLTTLSSPSLQHFHWDCLTPGSALSWFADAISNNKFPRLQTAKVPCDYDGLIQQLCRPIPREKLTTQDLEYLHEHTSRHHERNLRVSQIQAQVRVRESRQQPSFNVVVEDEYELKATHTIGSYLGAMGSKIEYQLEPDVGPNALAEFDDIAQPVEMGINGHRVERRMEANMLF